MQATKAKNTTSRSQRLGRVPVNHHRKNKPLHTLAAAAAGAPSRAALTQGLPPTFAAVWAAALAVAVAEAAKEAVAKEAVGLVATMQARQAVQPAVQPAVRQAVYRVIGKPDDLDPWFLPMLWERHAAWLIRHVLHLRGCLL